MHPNKQLGQHFLKDQKVVEDIIHSAPPHYASILEIGPGPGVLTRHLSQMGVPLILIEKDPRFAELHQVEARDALNVETMTMMSELTPPTWLVSNLPYNVSVPIMIKFMQIPAIEFCTFMTQKEVAEKALALLDKEPMNSLHFLLNNYFELKLVRHVRPGAFNPPPKVDSSVFTMQRRETPSVAWEDFNSLQDFLRPLFNFRRKKISNILKTQFNFLLPVGDPVGDKRPGTLTYDEVNFLFQKIVHP